MSPDKRSKLQDQKPKILTAFGRRIRELRQSRGFSQEQLAELTGFHRTYIGMVERGERNLSLSNVAVFASVFELSLSELLDFKRGER